MTSHRRAVHALGILALCLVLVVAGCLSEGENDPERGEGEITLSLGYQDDGVARIDGNINFQLAERSSVAFEDVMLCAYSEDGRLLNQSNLGVFRTDVDQASVELRFSERPRYLVVDHPNFTDYPYFYTGHVEWKEDTVRPGGGPPESDIHTFDYRRPTEPGTCYKPE